MSVGAATQLGNFPGHFQPSLGDRTLWQLSETLQKHDIDTRQWGLGPYKSLGDLCTEMEQGDSRLTLVDGRLYRQCSVLRIDVRYWDSDTLTQYKLFETRQVFADGRRRMRQSQFAVWEKLTTGEDPDSGVLRALRQELQIDSGLNLSFLARGLIKERYQDFPGLPSLLMAADYRVDLTPEQFKPKGYAEPQSDKTTYFRWRIVNRNGGPLETNF